MAPTMAEAESECAEVFKQFDKNGDGSISRDELAEVFRAIDQNYWDNARLQQLLDHADQNGDGQIDYVEFIHWLMADDGQFATDRTVACMKSEKTLNRPSMLVDWRQAAGPMKFLRLQVDQSRGRKLGLKVDSSDGRTLVIGGILKGGLVADWNAKTRDRNVTPGDRIVEVNDLSGDAQRLMKEMRKQLPMDLVIIPGEDATSYRNLITDHFNMESHWSQEGSYGCVRKARHLKTQAVYAVKTTHKRLTSDQQMQNMVDILNDLNHRNVLKLFEIFEDCLDYHLITEFCSGGELFDHVLKDNYFNERQAASVTQQILVGVGYLHSRGVCHRSLRPEHVLLEAEKLIEHCVVKIIDFRTARRFQEGEFFEDRVGQPIYMSPEMACGRPHNHMTDLWSCGIMLYFLLVGYPPFAGENDRETLRLVQVAATRYPENDWKQISDTAREFVGSLLASDWRQRPGAAKAAQHKWCKDLQPEGKSFPLHRVQGKMKDFCGQSKLKKAALHEVARRIKTEDIEKLAETFSVLDRNGDHLITFVELKEGFDKLGKSDSLDQLRHMMEQMDLDGNRQIDYTEFLAATLDRRVCNEEEALLSTFQAFDLDRDGALSVEELREVLCSEKVQDLVETCELKRIIEECDADSNGKIDFKEFMGMMHRDLAPPHEMEEL